MTIRKAKVEIRKVGQIQFEVLFGQPGWQEGDSRFHYQAELEATGFTNINMNKWPPEPFDGKYRIAEGVGSQEGFKAENLTWLKVVLQPGAGYSPSFDVTYIDETAEEPQEEVLAEGVTEYTWYAGFPWKGLTIGGATLGTITYATTRSAGKTAVATAVGSFFGWLIEKSQR